MKKIILITTLLTLTLNLFCVRIEDFRMPSTATNPWTKSGFYMLWINSDTLGNPRIGVPVKIKHTTVRSSFAEPKLRRLIYNAVPKHLHSIIRNMYAEFDKKQI